MIPHDGMRKNTEFKRKTGWLDMRIKANLGQAFIRNAESANFDKPSGKQHSRSATRFKCLSMIEEALRKEAPEVLFPLSHLSRRKAPEIINPKSIP